MFAYNDYRRTWPTTAWPATQVIALQGITFVVEPRPRLFAQILDRAWSCYAKSRLPLVLLLADLCELERRRRAAKPGRIMQILCRAWWRRRARRRAVRHGPVLLNVYKIA